MNFISEPTTIMPICLCLSLTTQMIGTFLKDRSGFSEMHALAIILIILKLLRVLNCSQQTHVDHVCHSGASTEQAGMGSGTLTFNGTLCELTITEIPEFQKENSKTIDQISRLNIVGVRRNESCDSSQSS